MAATECSLAGESDKILDDGFSFLIATTGREDDLYSLVMRDGLGNEIFRLISSDLPTSAEEEEIPSMLEELHELARRQALKVEGKIVKVYQLLDRV